MTVYQKHLTEIGKTYNKSNEPKYRIPLTLKRITNTQRI